MVEKDDQGNVVISTRVVTLLGASAGIIGAIGGAVIVATLAWGRLVDKQEGQQQDLGRVWSFNDKMEKDIKDLVQSLDAFKDLYKTKHQDLTDIVNNDRSRIVALSDNIRILESNINSISTALTNSVHEESTKSDKILEQVGDLRTTLARVEERVGKEHPFRPDIRP